MYSFGDNPMCEFDFMQVRVTFCRANVFERQSVCMHDPIMCWQRTDANIAGFFYQ